MKNKNPELLDGINKLHDLAILYHEWPCYDDCPACPKYYDKQDTNAECSCGADDHNKEVEEVFKKVMEKIQCV